MASIRRIRAERSPKAGMIVIGTHGRTGLAKLFLGSIAGRVVATAKCPVMTVRGNWLRENRGARLMSSDVAGFVSARPSPMGNDDVRHASGEHPASARQISRNRSVSVMIPRVGRPRSPEASRPCPRASCARRPSPRRRRRS